MNMTLCKDVSENQVNRFEGCALARKLGSKSFDVPIRNYDVSLVRPEAQDVREENLPIKNKQDGLAREREVEQELAKRYPEDKGYSVISEAYLRDKEGHIVKDALTGEARRIDFVIVKSERVVDSIEVTSITADKTLQTAKEERIRNEGGNYIRDNNGNLIEIPFSVYTRIERRD